MAMGSIAISQDGKLLYQKAFGDTILDELLSTTETKYRIGSVSKLFTSVLIFQLIEDGKLNLNETVDLYISDIPKLDIVILALHHNPENSDGSHNIDWKEMGNTIIPFFVSN